MHASVNKPYQFRREPRLRPRHVSLGLQAAKTGEVSSWHVLNVFTGREVDVTEELLDLGYAAFCPMQRTRRLKPVTQRRKGQDHYRTVESALIPAYVFVGLAAGDNLAGAMRCEHLIGALGSSVTMMALSIPKADVHRLAEECAAGRYDATIMEAERIAAMIGKTITLPEGHALAGLEATVKRASRRGVEAEVFLLGATRAVKMSVADAEAGGA